MLIPPNFSLHFWRFSRKHGSKYYLKHSNLNVNLQFSKLKLANFDHLIKVGDICLVDQQNAPNKRYLAQSSPQKTERKNKQWTKTHRDTFERPRTEILWTKTAKKVLVYIWIVPKLSSYSVPQGIHKIQLQIIDSFKYCFVCFNLWLHLFFSGSFWVSVCLERHFICWQVEHERNNVR